MAFLFRSYFLQIFFFTFLWRKLPEEKEVARKVSDAKTNSRKLNVFVVFDSVSNVAAWVVHPLATTHFEPPRFSGPLFRSPSRKGASEWEKAAAAAGEVNGNKGEKLILSFPFPLLRASVCVRFSYSLFPWPCGWQFFPHIFFFSFLQLLHYFNVCSFFPPSPRLYFFSFVINLEVEHSTGRHFLFFTFSPHQPEPHPLPSPPHPPFSRTSLIFQFCQLLWSENVAGERSTASFSPIAKVEMGCVGYICLYAICKIIYRCLNQNGQSKGFRFLIYFFIETPFFFSF